MLDAQKEAKLVMISTQRKIRREQWNCLDCFRQLYDAGQAEFSHLGLDIIHVARSASPFTPEIMRVVRCQMRSCGVPSLHAVVFRVNVPLSLEQV